MLASTAMTCAVGALLPPVPGLVLFTLGLVVAWALLAARVEHLAVRLLYRGAPLSVADQRVLAPVVAALRPHGLGPPLIQIWARPGGLATDVTAAGRSSVLVNRSLIDAIRRGDLSLERAASVIAHAAGLARSGATRADPFLRFWTIPWVLLTRSMVALAGVVGVAGLVRVMWKARWVLTAVAAVQAVAASHPGLAVLVVDDRGGLLPVVAWGAGLARPAGGDRGRGGRPGPTRRAAGCECPGSSRPGDVTGSRI